MPSEPEIIINGKRLTEGQAMTLRVALEGFLLDTKTYGLGGDENGKAIAKAYMDRGSEIRVLMFNR